jgi:hypothetical protein
MQRKGHIPGMRRGTGIKQDGVTDGNSLLHHFLCIISNLQTAINMVDLPCSVRSSDNKDQFIEMEMRIVCGRGELEPVISVYKALVLPD